MVHLRSRRARTLVVLLSLSLMLGALRLGWPSQPERRVEGAWVLANDVGRYAFRSTVLQTVHPTERVENGGHTAKTTKLELEGRTDRDAELLELTITGYQGQDRSIELRVEGHQSWGRNSPEAAWQPLDMTTDVFAPSGDPLGFLSAAENIQPSSGDGSAAGAASYTFDVDERRFARYMSDQLAEQLRSEGSLPAGLEVGTADVYLTMQGSGEIWLNEQGLPERMTLHLAFPPEKGALNWVEAEVATSFSRWAPTIGVTLSQAWSHPQLLAASLSIAPAAIQQAGFSLSMLLITLGGMALLVRGRSSRRVYTSVATAVTLSMLVVPLLQAREVAAFSADQQAQASAAQERQTQEQRAEEVQAALRGEMTDPHANPLGEGVSIVPPAGSAPAGPSLAMRLPLDSTDTFTTGADYDQDGLDDDIELLKLNTNPALSDTDGDEIKDIIEVMGFSWNGRTWYLNPNEFDSNLDSLSDLVECTNLLSATTSTSGLACEDLDGDGTPDVYDFDNDGDSVPDSVDASPFYIGTLGTTAQDTLNFQVSDMSADATLYVDVQLRPENPEHLWYSGNVLDWPTNDRQGQIARVHSTTYLDEGYTGSKLGNGDMLLTPMLEITIPYSSTNPSGGLPVRASYSGTVAPGTIETWLDQEILDSYGISVNLSSDGDSYLVYVPVTTVTDEIGDMPVAFSARMYYRLQDSDWGDTQQARLIWFVNALTDTCDTSAMPEAIKYDTWCAIPTNWTTSDTLIQTYYDSFYVTAFTVQQDYGMQAALIGQVNAADSPTDYENYLWHLANNLQYTYLEGQNTDSTSGNRFDIADIAARFDVDSTTYADGAEERWGIPKSALDVEVLTYDDQGIGLTEMSSTDVITVLDSIYPNATAGTSITLLLVHEQTFEQAGIDSESDASFSNGVLQMSMASTTNQVAGTLSWTPYIVEEAADGSTEWAGADLTEYIAALDDILVTIFDAAEVTALLAMFGDTPDTVDLSRAGAISQAENFYLAMSTGTAAFVEIDATSVSTGTAVTDALYQLGTTEAATQIAYESLSLQYEFFVAESSKTLDGEMIASGITMSVLTDPTIILEDLGSSWSMVNAETQSWITGAGVGTAKLTKTAWISFYKWRYMKGIATSTVQAEKAGKISMMVSIAAISVVILMQVGVIEKSLVLEISVKVLGGFGQALTIYKSISQYYFLKSGLNVSNDVVELTGIAHTAQTLKRSVKIGAIIGAAVGVVIAIAFMALIVYYSDIGFGDLEFSQLLATTIATIIVTILMAVIAATLVGSIFIAILGLCDIVISIICRAVGVEPGSTAYMWGCGGISGLLTTAITYVIFDQTPMVNFEKSNRVSSSFEDPTITKLAEQDGFVVGNQLNLSMTVTSSIYMNTPNWMGYTYYWQYSHENLEDTKITYALQSEPDDVNPGSVDWVEMNEEEPVESWFKDNERFRYVFEDVTLEAMLEEVGLNQQTPIYLTESIEADAQECWLIWTPLGLVPVCYVRNGNFEYSEPVDLSAEFTFDVLPASLDEFYTLTSARDGGFRLAWDASFPVLMDADGDGLTSAAYNGPDPADNTWDYDGDGLTDYWEYENDTNMLSSDSDGDSLSDYWEVLHTTDTDLADSDGDGLTDGEEVFHSDLLNASDNRSATWDGGWDYVYDYSGTTALKTLVQADPTMSNSDDDDISDRFEYVYGYNPTVFSDLNVLSISSTLAIDSEQAGHIAPGGAINYTATVKNELDNRYAYGQFETEFPIDTTAKAEVLEALAPQDAVTVSGSVMADPTIFTTTTITSMTLRASAIIEEADTGRALWLEFNESASGTPSALTFLDSSLLGNDAACTSSTMCPTTNGATLTFNGTSNYVSVPASSDFDITNSTVSLWVKPSSSKSQVLFSSSSVEISLTSANKVSMTVAYNSCASSSTSTGSSILTNGSWSHIGVTSTGTAITLYVNGQAETTIATSTGCGITSEIVLGRSRSTATGYFSGSLDEVELYTAGLTAAQVSDLANKPVFSLTDWVSGSSFESSSPYGSVTLACGETCPSQFPGVTNWGFNFNALAPTAKTTYLLATGDDGTDIVADDSSFTISMWISPEETYEPSSQYNRDQGSLLIGNVLNGYKKAPPSLFIKGQNLILRFGLSGGTSYCETTTSGNPLTYGTWQHIAVSYNGTVPTLYVDGVASSATWTTTSGTSCSGVTPYKQSVAGSWQFYIGSSRTTAIYFKSFGPVTLGQFSGESPPHEAYLWNVTTNKQIWDSGSVITSGSTATINAWATLDRTSTAIQGSALSYTFCNRDDSPAGALCPGDDDFMVTGGQNLVTFDYDDPLTAHMYAYTTDGQTALTAKLSGNLVFEVHNDHFEGSLDDVELYRKALSADQVEDLYESAGRSLELKFDEATGQDTFEDTSGNAYDGACSATTGTCPTSGLAGLINQDLTFDGTDDTLTLEGTTTDVGIYNGSFTVMAWVKGDTFTSDRAILGVAESDADSQGLHLTTRNGVPYMGFLGNDTTASQTLSAGTWYHLAYVYDYSGKKQSIFINGVQSGSTGTSKSAYAGEDQTLYVGSAQGGSFFDGEIDHLVIVRDNLSATQIQAVMNEAPAFNLHLDESLSTTTFDDETINNSNLRCSGTACPMAGDKGQMHEAASFDGDDKLSTSSTSSALNMDTNFSIALWVKPETDSYGNWQYLLRKHNGSGSQTNYNLFILSNSLYFKFDLMPASTCSSSGVRHVTSGAPMVKNQWNHIVATYDTNTLRIYLNGSLSASENHSATSTVAACATGSTLTLGENFYGALDEVSITDALLDDDDVAALYDYQSSWYDISAEHEITVDVEGPALELSGSGGSSAGKAASNTGGQYVRADTETILSILTDDDASYVTAVQYCVGTVSGCTSASGWQEVARSESAEPTSSSAWPFTLPALAHGSHTLSISATDSVGNWTAESLTIYADGVAPSSTVDASLTSGVLQVTDTLTLKGTLSDAEDSIQSGVDSGATSVDLLDHAGISVSGSHPALGDLTGTLLELELDEEFGSTSFADTSGNELSAVCSVSTCPTAGLAGYRGNALSFSGSQYAVVTNTFSLNTFTMAAWIYPTSTDTGFHGFLGYANGLAPASRGPSMWLNQANRIHAGFGNGTTWYAFNSNPVVTANAWNHVVFTFDGTTMMIYVNGMLAGSSTSGSGKTPIAPPKIEIGRTDTSFQGSIDDVLILNNALSSSAVAELYGSAWEISYPFTLPPYGTYVAEITAADTVGGSATTTETIVLDGYGPLADLSSTSFTISQTGSVLRGVLTDQLYPASGRAFHLHGEESAGATSFADGSQNHYTASCSGSSCPTAGASGKYGSALSFDGGDTLSTADDTVDLNAGSFTIAAWVKTTGVTQGIITKSDGDSTWEAGEKSLYLDSSGRPTFVGYGNESMRSTTAINDGSWHHVAVTWDVSTAISTIFIDGVDRTDTATTNYIANHADNPTDTLGVGRANYSTGGASAQFSGMLDEVAIYSEALGEEVIYDIANPVATNVASLKLRFRHASEADVAETAGTWYTATLASTASGHTTWSYTLTTELEGPYRIDLKATDSLGNESYIAEVWTGEIDTMAPRVTFSYALDGTTAQVNCSASDYNLTTAGWVCPVADTHRTAGYQAASWFTAIFAGSGYEDKLATLSTSTQTVSSTGTAMTACDIYGNCTTRTSAQAKTEGSVQTLIDQVAKLEAATATRSPAATQSEQIPPRGLTLTVLANGQPLPDNRTIEAVQAPTLTAQWSSASDASGIAGYQVIWRTYSPAGVPTIVQSTTLAADQTSQSRGAAEARMLTVEVAAIDGEGNHTSEMSAPFFVDYITTPAYIPHDSSVYDGWRANACNVLGVDPRIAGASSPIDSRNEQQRFYGTWDMGHLALAWEGADWRTEGDLFIYLDTKPGGSTQAYNPYSATISTTAILLPALAVPSGPATPMGADYLVWVREDAESAAQLLAWDAGAWTEVVGTWHYQFDTQRAAPLTSITLPFATLGITTPASQTLNLVALASEEDGLNVWATMPRENSLNSEAVVGSLVRDEVQLFMLSRALRWPALAAGSCPSGVDATGTRHRASAGDRIMFNGAALEATLVADPQGVAYGLLRRQLIFAHQTLFADQADWSSTQSSTCPLPPPGMPSSPQCQRTPDDGQNSGALNVRTQLARLFGVDHQSVTDGQTITYTLRIVNTGDRRAEGVMAEVTTPWALRLPQGQIVSAPDAGQMYRQTITVGTLQAGEERTITFTGLVDPSWNAAKIDGWVRLRTLVWDETGGTDQPSEDLHLDHELDTVPPSHAELLTPRALIGGGQQVLEGAVADQSAVPTIIVEVAGQATTCTDATPTDGRWSCAINLGPRSEGQTLPVRLKARDIHGQESPWMPGPTLVVDATAPQLALSEPFSQTLRDGVLGLEERILSGVITDNHVVGGVEVCAVEDGAERCVPAEMERDASTITQEVFTYDDQPGTPLPIGSANACTAGTPIIRTFSVPESFTVADVDLGLAIAHPFRNDLVVVLRAPSGAEVEVVSRGSTAQNLDVWLDDAAQLRIFLDDDAEDHSLSANDYGALRRPFPGRLTTFRGVQAQGTWQLRICDHTPAADDGTYLQARLSLRAAVVPGPTSGAWRASLAMRLNTEEASELRVYGYDQSGNRSLALSLAPEIDTKAPEVLITTEPVSGTLFALGGTVSDVHSITMRLDIRTPSGRLRFAPISSTDGIWGFTDTSPFDRPGSYCVWVVAEDIAGNSVRHTPIAIEVSDVVTPPPSDGHQLYLPLVRRSGVAGKESDEAQPPAARGWTARTSSSCH